jgi:hypothetical protein
VIDFENDPVWQQIIARRMRERDATLNDEAPKTVLDWAKRYRRIDGKPFTLANFKPNEAIYQDGSKDVVIMKPVQRGISEYAINLACFALDNGAHVWTGGDKEGLNIGYVFPTKQDLEDFAKERVNGLKEEHPHLFSMFTGEEFDALGFKKVGRSYMYLRGGVASAGLMSFPADLLIIDEYDKMSASAVVLARKRLNASEVARSLLISTPTTAGRGIHAAYMASDRHIWETQCPYPECAEWVSFDFFRDVYIDNVPYDEWRFYSQAMVEDPAVAVQLLCPSCKSDIQPVDRLGPGRWRAEAPERRVRGYHIPWWPYRFIDLRQMCFTALSSDPDEVQELFRSDLGLPYSSGGNAIAEDMIYKLSAEWGPDYERAQWRNTTMGVDIGSRLHYRVSSEHAITKRRVVRDMGSVGDWSGLDALMMRFQVRQCIVDYKPEIHDAIAFAKKWRGRVLCGDYPSNANSLRGVMFFHKDDPDDFIIQINRTMAMDRVHATIASGDEIWPPTITHDPEVVGHLTSPVRIKSKDSRGQEITEWVHTRPDHLFHACVYDIVAGESLPKASQFTAAAGGERALVNSYNELIDRDNAYVPASRHGTLPRLERM